MSLLATYNPTEDQHQIFLSYKSQVSGQIVFKFPEKGDPEWEN